MPAPLLAAGAQMMCPHPPGKIVPATKDLRVKVSGQPVLLVTDLFAVAACGLTGSTPPPGPCVRCQWATPATRVRIQGQPALLQSSVGTCFAAASPAGPAVVSVNQARVLAT